MFCEKCGAQNEGANQFCQNCGQPLVSAPAPIPDTLQALPPDQPKYAAGQQPVYTQPNQDEHVSVGQWIGYFLLNFIPCVGPLVYLVMLFVWAFGDTPKKSLKTFAKAQLIMMLIGVALAIVVIIIMSISLYDSFSSYYSG